MTDTNIISATSTYVQRLRQSNPNILFVVKRSKNENIVVYEWNPKKQMVDVYWLDIDPIYQQAARKRGVMSDRNELNFIERNKAYGCSTIKSGTAIHLTVIPLQSYKILVKLDGNGGGARAEITLDGTNVSLQFIYVKTHEGFLLPTVLYVEAFGTNSQGTMVRSMIKK